ncbi:FAS1-like dehydratase domain-containing protein [Halocatena marina]|uniref:FAS1-like dehydratase domain-containing protein n=1 Tax=Halocatena marina TaxID=2934937 RepID=UPI0020102DA3|nr:MaoC family dehydratase N-terminal domain-containing protein [Halocatena marina]
MTEQHEHLQERIGETHTTVQGLVVEAGKVAEFARAVSDDNPIHYDPEAAKSRGFDSVPAPLTFTRTGVFPRYRTGAELDLGFRPAYVLHGEHSYEYERPLLVGDVVSGETTLVDVYEREGSRGGTMTFAEVETVYRDRSDERVLAERATVIETDGAVTESSTDRTPHGDHDDGHRLSDTDHSLESQSSEQIERATLPDSLVTETTAPDPARMGTLEVGDTAPTVTVGPLRRHDFVRYAGSSGDFNPIHYDEPYAQAAGNPSVFGQGMFTAGIAAHMVADWFGLDAVKMFSIRFQSQTWSGDTITANAEVTSVNMDDGDEYVEADLHVVRADGERVLTGQATAVLPE